MSIDALSWAFKQAGISSSQKFVLIALANHCNDEGLAYPGTQTIIGLTMYEEKTIKRCIDHLIESGMIQDTGQTKGSTGRTKVYRLPIEHFSNHHKLCTKNGIQLIPTLSPQYPHNTPIIPTLSPEPIIRNQEPGTIKIEKKYSKIESDLQEAVSQWIKSYETIKGKTYLRVRFDQLIKKDTKAMAQILKSGFTVAEIQSLADSVFKNKKGFYSQNLKTIQQFRNWIQELRDENPPDYDPNFPGKTKEWVEFHLADQAEMKKYGSSF